MSSNSSSKHENSLLNDPTSKNKFESRSPQITEDSNRKPNLTTEPSVNKLPHSLTISSPNIIQLPTEHSQQPSLTNTTLFKSHKKDKL
jgi:hypothetical protein